jgi:hypothetical protein
MLDASRVEALCFPAANAPSANVITAKAQVIVNHKGL